ncbi:MAG: branched-chain amino acid transaminase [Nitrospinae bacterium]|nr:branched-chain amino acid transaminase [Nitrospinota bacterium]
MATNDKSGLKVWLNDTFVNWDDANVHVMTHTLHYGVGVFEGIRCYETADGPAILRLKEHIDRLFNSAKIIGMPVNESYEQVYNAIIETVKVNNLSSCYIRPLFFLDHSSLGLNCIQNKVMFAVAAWEWGAYLGQEGLDNGIRTKISSFTRHHPNISMTKAKVCGGYVNSILAKLEALRDGYEEAILLDTLGHIAEGSGENIFIVKNNKLITPPTTSVLDGISRDIVFNIAKDLGIQVVEQYFSRDTLYIADEAFFTGTAAEITPIREVDNISLGKKPGAGEITKKIQAEFFRITKGENPDYKHWLDFII